MSAEHRRVRSTKGRSEVRCAYLRERNWMMVRSGGGWCGRVGRRLSATLRSSVDRATAEQLKWSQFSFEVGGACRRRGEDTPVSRGRAESQVPEAVGYRGT